MKRTLATTLLLLLLAACGSQPINPIVPPTSSAVASTTTAAEPAPEDTETSPAPPPEPTVSSPLPTTDDVLRPKGYQTYKLPHDGDTFRVSLPDGRSQAVRVLGIQAPEVPPKPLQCYGPESQVAVRTILIPDTKVLLKADLTQGDSDRYDRWLRYVSVPKHSDVPEIPDLAAYLLKKGLATVYTQYPVPRTPDYLRLEAQARADQIGLWAPTSKGGCQAG